MDLDAAIDVDVGSYRYRGRGREIEHRTKMEPSAEALNLNSKPIIFVLSS